MMSAAQKILIKKEFDYFVRVEGAEGDKRYEQAHQAIRLKATIYVLPHNEFHNAMRDAREALTESSYYEARRKLAFARRHHLRGKHLHLGITVFALEKHIRKRLKDLSPRRVQNLEDMRRELKRIRTDRLAMPRLRRSAGGGSLKDVQRQNLKLHSECIRWGGLLERALRVYKATVKIK